MRRLTLIPALVVLVTMACGPRGGGELPVLDVTASYPELNITLQEIADVEYVPLETREGFLIDHRIANNIDEQVVVNNNSQGDIMIFDRHTGKGITTFNRTGRGPGEYTGIGRTALDSRKGEIFVTPNTYNKFMPFPIYVYDMQGKHLRTLELRGGEVADGDFLHDYDEGHLFFRNSDEMRPWIWGLISKTDTLITHMPVEFKNRDNMRVSITMGEMTGFMTRGGPVAKTREGYMISEPGIDTIYNWNRRTGELIPVMTRTPSFGSMEYPVGLFYWQQSGDYIFLETWERRYDFETGEGFRNVKLIYNKRSGEFFEGKILNADFVDPKEIDFGAYDVGYPPGQIVLSLPAFELTDLHEQGKLKGRLAEIAATLKEDDNPVMMIATFK